MVDRFIKSLDGKAPAFHPNCFYLSWLPDGPTPRYTATWCQYRDMDRSKNKFAVYVKWRDLPGNNDIMIATDYLSTPYDVNMAGDNPYKNKEYLKSHLQKSIRRSNASRAIKTAWHFLDLDLQEFLRRLAIIAVEDCLPLDGYSTIVWFVVAISKGYRPSNEQICWILGYVHDLAVCNKYEQIAHTPNITVASMRLKSLSQEGKNLVYSIILRKSYGGMDSDKAMCMNAALLWFGRFSTSSKHLELLRRPNIFMTPPTGSFLKAEWYVVAIDFHCCPNIIDSMWEKHDQFLPQDIRSAIWHCSSSVTDKVNISSDLRQRLSTEPKYLNIWKTIRKDFMSYARFMLDRNG